MPEHHKRAVLSLDDNTLDYLTEIRLRLGKPLSAVIKGSPRVISAERLITDADIEITTARAFRNSVFNYKREISEGYITVQGGCRVGLCGTAIKAENESNAIEGLKYISSLNIRIACEHIGCAEKLYYEYFEPAPVSLLIAGAPLSGKTTFLRDLVRLVGNNSTLSLIDERGELAASFKGIPQNDIGRFTDVFTSYNRQAAIVTAVRVMSPQVIACDEIGAPEDLKALEYALHSGVKLIATCHCSSLEELHRKPVIAELLTQNAFELLALVDKTKLISTERVNKNRCLKYQAV